MFKVGDKVKCIDESGLPYALAQLRKGQLYVVSEVIADEAGNILCLDGNPDYYSFYRFEPYVVTAPTQPTPAAIRKGQPVATGVLAYFPDAIKAVAEVSRIGNDQHNPGQPLHWARGKSTDQLDAGTRHLMDYLSGTPVDTDGGYHLAKAAWRILAQLQPDRGAQKGGAK